MTQLWLVTQWQYILPAVQPDVFQVQHLAETGTVLAAGQVGAVCIAAAVSVTFRSVFTPVLPLVAVIALHMCALLILRVVIALQCLWAVLQQDLLKMFKAVAVVVFADICMLAVLAAALA